MTHEKGSRQSLQELGEDSQTSIKPSLPLNNETSHAINISLTLLFVPHNFTGKVLGGGEGRGEGWGERRKIANEEGDIVICIAQ